MPFNPVERLRFVPLALLGAVCGFLSVFPLAVFVDPEPQLRRDLFHLIRTDDEPAEITQLRAQPLGFGFGDFDAVLEVELPPDSDFDIVFRWVEPQFDEEPFHGRFGVLRLSTVADGPAFLTRERALFGRRAPGGVLVAPGRPATVHLEARGHFVRATVAGRRLPWFETVDDFGRLALVLHGGGRALVRYLNIQPLARAPAVDPWLWFSVTGAVLGLAISLFGAGFWRGACSLLTMPAVALVTGFVVFSQLLPETRPSTTGMLAALLPSLPIAIAIAARARRVGTVMACLAVVVLWEVAARVEQPRLGPIEDPRLSAHFGRTSGRMPFDVLAGRLSSSAPSGVQLPRPADRRIVFAGGGYWYEAGGQRDVADNLGLLAAARTAQLTALDVDGVVVPTLWSTVDQQVALLAEFVAPRFEPDLVVLAVSSDELERSERFRPCDVLDGRVRPPSGLASVLLATWLRALSGDVAPGSPGTVAAALERLDALAAARGFTVVLFRPEPLPAELDAVLRAASDAHGWRLLDRPPGATTIEVARLHAQVFVQLLKP